MGGRVLGARGADAADAPDRDTIQKQSGPRDMGV
jgi:hypothetical protein